MKMGQKLGRFVRVKYFGGNRPVEMSRKLSGPENYPVFSGREGLPMVCQIPVHDHKSLQR